MFAPEQPLTVTLRADQWNTVLGLMADGAYRVVNPLIQEMQRQLLQQSPEPQERVVPFRPQEAPPAAAPQPESA